MIYRATVAPNTISKTDVKIAHLTNEFIKPVYHNIISIIHN